MTDRHWNTTHGMSYSPTWYSWCCMKNRCIYPNNPSFRNYGGKGIKVCDRWKKFTNFLEDMGVKPDGAQLDRLDSAKDYAPDNCRWATTAEQARNRNTNLRLSAFGETKILADWITDNRCLVSGPALVTRIRRGWNLERALTRPLYGRGDRGKK